MILLNSAAAGGVSLIVWIVILFGFMYLFMIRPQQKETKKKNALMESLAVGDTVLTTSGFYGVVIDLADEDTVIVEFGNNKNCRIPMQKAAISAVEKPEDAVQTEEVKPDAEDTGKKKGFFKK
ncbi:MAG: preprotein translocase subunit YajC [Lachnospiraceae bacterium]|jgi:preprotein translocase subunit YajC|nr:preprotein translocase subunit YajC [Lachnospiraceae bacterium]MDY5703761.1 preprotein translocase subunit YajC [Lachnospiraceae bacterium]MEE3356724.1 preprotein translocase subunit YajC [Lachnospiraceae bacterium]